ncbi:DUF2281 domain-containing protein [Rhodohalobacter sp. 614A]|uniref:DUF2281 domain-containing protein n=1 Tax=Rhodohalobacter sp. 614A TaxID=2908649 RepID=UPI001F3DB930|nr:DUF2281 domain-containing protein [Rhodohalobacter sp. 614A]
MASFFFSWWGCVYLKGLYFVNLKSILNEWVDKMSVAEKINKRIRSLPEASQTEVLHFVEFLLDRSTRTSASHENQEWAIGSLSSAMHGIETDNEPIYSESDIKEHFS